MKRILAILLLLPLGGCAVAVVGAAAGAAYVWVNGELKGSLPAELPKVDKATRAALTDLELVGVEGRVDRLKGKITARMADGTRVEIRLKAIDFKSTSIRIRVGTLGDKAISEQILRHIEKELGLKPGT
jgi:hypothetical protein